MDLGVLADHVAVADAEPGGRAAIRQVLRLVSDDGAGMDDVVRPERAVTGEEGMRHHAGARADADRPVDHDVGTDLRAGIDLRARVDGGGGMDRHLRAAPLLVVRRRLRLGRDLLAGNAIALVRPGREIEHAAPLGAERPVRVSVPRGLAAASGAPDASHG